MAWTVNAALGAQSEDLALLHTCGADVSSVASGGEQWYKSDLTGDANQGEYGIWVAGQGLGYMRSTCFPLLFTLEDGAPTQRAQLARNNTNTRKLFLNTDRKLELWDGATYYVGSTVLAADTVYEIAIVLDWRLGEGNLSRELVYLNKSIEIDRRLTCPAGDGGVVRLFGENLGANNPGCSLYFRSHVFAQNNTAGDAELATMFQYQLGHANAVGDESVSWTQSDGGGDHYEDLNERPPDDGTTEVYAASTGLQEWIAMTTRADMGIGASDTIDFAYGYFRIKETANGGTKWSAEKGHYWAAPGYTFEDLADPGTSWVWEEYELTGLDTVAKLADWGLVLRTKVSGHDEVAHWSTALAFVVHHGSGDALPAPPSEARRQRGAFVG